MPGCPFDDPGGDRQSVRQDAIVLESFAVVVDVVGGFVDGFARALVELLAGRGTASIQKKRDYASRSRLGLGGELCQY